MKDVGINLLLSVLLIGFFVWLYRKKRIPKTGYGIYNDKGRCARQLLAGCLIGLLSMIAVLLISAFISGQKIVINDHISIADVVLYLFYYIAVGVEEELLFRGFIIGEFRSSELKETSCVWTSAIIFAAAHSGNNGLNLLALINLCLFGAICAKIYYRTNNLCLSIGIHIAWNFFEAMFGFNVSGFVIPYILRLEGNLSTLVGGGDFGPEGGVVVSGILLLQLLGLIYIERRNQLHRTIKKEGS